MLNSADRTISSYHSFSSTGSISVFNEVDKISGLSVTGAVRLNSDTSTVRIILVDKQYNEYLVYEVYPLLVDNSDVKFQEVSEETNSLNSIEPLSIRVEITDATCKIFELNISEGTVVDDSRKRKSLNEQRNYKIDKIRENLKKNNQHWIAAETSISTLSYAEKKTLFGGELPNLNGFEYYAGGVFTIGDTEIENSIARKSLSESNYVSDFSWRNRHGIDWTTSVKKQGSCGSCWAFSTTGATEILANLYFNQKLDLDLSEQNLLNSVAGSSCNGGYPGDALRYIRSNGIVSENCMPYAGAEVISNEQCGDPEERIQISGIQYFSDKNEESLKNFILNGPVSLGINSWKHTVTLIGYKVLQEGDTIRNQSFGGTPDVLSAGDPLIGKTAWVIKNSWGTDWGEEGFAYIVLDMDDISSTYQVFGDVKSLNYSESDVACTDNDGDGYYFWGLGPKPDHCPPCPEEPDSNDSDKCIGPADEYGNSMNLYPQAPIAFGAAQCETQNIAVLSAKGESISWYDGKDLLHEGSDFYPGNYSVGMHSFYATQTIDGCESYADTTFLKVTEAPAPPLVFDTIICQGESIQSLTVIGEKIKWFDAQTSVEQSQKSLFLDIGNASPGTYTYYVTQEENGCESFPAEATVTVREKPDVDLGDYQLTISADETVELSTNQSFESYQWNDGDINDSKYLEGQTLGEGVHFFSIEVRDEFNCSNADSVQVFVAYPNNLGLAEEIGGINIYPNPSKGYITLNAENVFKTNIVQIFVLDVSGKRLWEQAVPNNFAEINLSLDLSSSLNQGIYLVVLTDNYTIQKQRIVIQ